MKVFVTKDRLISKNKLKKADERFRMAIEVAATGKPIDVGLVDNADGHILRVLFVDDHRANADTLTSLVSKWGHDSRRAYDGVTGLALAAAFRPDVLLLDMLMPDVSGFEVAMQVRRQNSLKNCFIVAVTGRTDAKHRTRCYEAGVDLFLIKPVPPTDLQALLSLEWVHVNRQKHSRHTLAPACREFAAAC